MSIALLGYGTVAKGTVNALKKRGVDIRRILVRRDIPEIADISTRDIRDITDDPEIELVAELMGGDEPAYSYVLQALRSGRHVVSANKQMISKHYADLLKTADRNGVCFAFSAAAGGGIPWLLNLIRFSSVDRVLSVSGIMNGTSNYILSRMAEEGIDFDMALIEAQRMGYAEADPTADIDGLDVRAKLALSCNIASGMMFDPESIPALGIRFITAGDIEYFRERRYVCRLIGRAELSSACCAYVEPVLFPEGAPEAGVSGAGNIISAELVNGGCFSFIGAGAGGSATGNAVAADIIDVISGRSEFTAAGCTAAAENRPELAVHRYYIGGEKPVITEPLSVAELHAAIRSRIAAGERAFAAGLAE